MLDINKLIEARNNKNMQIKEVSKKSKIGKKKLEEFENGNIEPTKEELEKLAKVYDVSIEYFYFKSKSKSNKLIIVLLIIIGLVIGFLSNNPYMYLIIPILLNDCYLSYTYLKNNYQITTKEEPKSFFNFIISDDNNIRTKLYIIECNIIASAYLILYSLCEIINFKVLLFNIKLIKDYNINKVLVYVIIYFLLFIISYIIEVSFGKYMLKNFKGDKNGK